MQQPAFAHDPDPVAEQERLVLVVGDEEGRDLLCLKQATDVEAEALAQVDVEIGEWLVQQDQPRPWGDRPREGDALLLAAGELVGIAVAEPPEADELEQRARRALALAP